MSDPPNDKATKIAGADGGSGKATKQGNRKSSCPESTALPRWLLADLKRSGLDAEDAKLLRIHYVPPEEMWELVNTSKNAFATQQPLPPAAYEITYFDATGKPVEFARYRFEKPYKPPGAKKAQRYWQAPDSGVHFFLPPSIDWKKVFADPSITIWITEGEKKAAALCKLRTPCIGLGGVWNFTTDGDPIAEWNLCQWPRRKAVIAFDSDAIFKKQVQSAVAALRKELIRRGASPYQVKLPQLPGAEKTGLDDLLKAKGLKALMQLPAEPLFKPDDTTAEILMQTKLAKPVWIVEDFIPTGLTMIAGAPKIGKSFLALQIILAVATESEVLGAKTHHCEVLYLALEDSLRRLQDRIKLLAGAKSKVPDVFLHVDWPRIEYDGLLALSRWLDEHPKCKLVFIDTLAKMRFKPSKNGNPYLEDYEAISALKTIADARNIAIVVVYHTRKADDDDPLNTISGTTGLTGSGDTYIVLKRMRTNAEGELFVTGRDVIAEKNLAVRFADGKWTNLGPADTYFVGVERRVILDVLKIHGTAMTPTELANLTGRKREATNRLMLRMMADRLLSQDEQTGKYSLAPVPHIKGSN